MTMRPIFVIISSLTLLCCAACLRKDVAKLPLDPNEERLKKLYAQQDVIYGDRYAASEAATDLERGTPKLYWVGLPSSHDPAWISIIQQRFSVNAEFIAGCEFSPRLGNFADAYNARILDHIAKKYGPNAFDDSQREAIELAKAKSPTAVQR